MANFCERRAGEILQAAHAAWSNGDVETLLQYCTDDVVYRSNFLPGARFEFRGKRIFRSYLRSLQTTVDSMSIAECFRTSNGLGLARVDWYMRHRHSGLVLSSSSRQIVSYRGELICDIQDFHDEPKLAVFWRLAKEQEAALAASTKSSGCQPSVITTNLHRIAHGLYCPASRSFKRVDDPWATMHFSEHERIGIFIDGPNLFTAVRTLGFDIDFRRLLDFFRSKARLVRALYFTAMAEGPEYSSIRPLVDWLDYNGFKIVTKAAKEFTDAGGRRRFRGDMDVELAVDAMRLAPSLDHLVLFSGDGGFRYLIEALQHMGKRVSVVSSLQTQPPLVADELRRQADQFIELSDLRHSICRRDPSARPTEGRP